MENRQYEGSQSSKIRFLLNCWSQRLRVISVRSIAGSSIQWMMNDPKRGRGHGHVTYFWSNGTDTRVPQNVFLVFYIFVLFRFNHYAVSQSVKCLTCFALFCCETNCSSCSPYSVDRWSLIYCILMHISRNYLREYNILLYAEHLTWWTWSCLISSELSSRFVLINYVSVLVHFLTVIIVCWGGWVLTESTTLFYQPLHLASHKIRIIW